MQIHTQLDCALAQRATARLQIHHGLSAKKSIKQFNREAVKIDKPQKQDAQYFQEASHSKQMCDFEMQFPSRLLPEVTAEPKIGEVGQQAVDAHSGNVCCLPGENEEGGEPSNTSSDWSSTVLGVESPRLSQESHFPKAPEMPRGMPELQNYRKHLAMELLWLQQAIASRKNVRILPLGCLLDFCFVEQP
ncbi:IQ domain-containing protein C, partial [Ophiophagus hannah]